MESFAEPEQATGNCAQSPPDAQARLAAVRAEMDDIATKLALSKQGMGPAPNLDTVTSHIREVENVMDTLSSKDQVGAKLLVGSGYWMLGNAAAAFQNLLHVSLAPAELSTPQDQVSAIMLVLPVLRKRCEWVQIVKVVDKTRALANGAWLDHSLPFIKGLALNNLNQPADAAEVLEEAINLDAAYEQAFVEFDYAVGLLGDMERCRRMAQKLVDRGGYWVNSWQRPAHFLVDSAITSLPWHEPQSFELVHDLESNFPVIKREVEALLAGKYQWGRVGSHDRGNENAAADSTLVRQGDWREIVLLGDSSLCEEHCAKCPETASILRRCPLTAGAAELRLGESLFSMLVPGTYLRPHCGPTNMRLTLHLGIAVPEGCTITCGGETRTWTEGKCIVFDDSYEHEVNHAGVQPRIVLLVNFWHPALPQERWKELVDQINMPKSRA